MTHQSTSRRKFLSAAASTMLGGAILPRIGTVAVAVEPSAPGKEADRQLLGNRFFTFNTVVRVRQVEISRDVAYGPDESVALSAGQRPQQATLPSWLTMNKRPYAAAMPS